MAFDLNADEHICEVDVNAFDHSYCNGRGDGDNTSISYHLASDLRVIQFKVNKRIKTDIENEVSVLAKILGPDDAAMKAIDKKKDLIMGLLMTETTGDEEHYSYAQKKFKKNTGQTVEYS